MLQDELLQSGFPKENIELIPDEQAAIDAALRGSKRGDLLVVFADMISRSWKQVIYFKPESAGGSSPPSAPGAGTEPSGGSALESSGLGVESNRDLLEGAQVIQDDRGVRLARERED